MEGLIKIFLPVVIIKKIERQRAKIKRQIAVQRMKRAASLLVGQARRRPFGTMKVRNLCGYRREPVTAV